MTWFVTGCSAGLGRVLVEALLARNQRVVASARRLETIRDLEAKGAVIVEWDVTWPLAKMQKTANAVNELVGGVDVLCNNAGFMIGGTIEETTEAQAFTVMNANVFGLLNTIRVFISFMRIKRSGTIVNISSVAGLAGNGAAGLYNASKYAVEGITEALAQETAHLGLRVTSICPGYFRTRFIQSAGKIMGPIKDYEVVTEPLEAGMAAYEGKQPGDPRKASDAIIDLVLGEGQAKGKPFPLRLVLGPDAFATAEKHWRKDLESLGEWEAVSCGTNFDE